MVNEKKRPKLKIILLFCGFTALLVALLLFGQPMIELFRNPDNAKKVVEDAGSFGPLVFIGLQLLQVLFAPIPGQVTGFIGGFLFGTFWGTIYALIGATIGFSLIFWLSRKLGRPFVEYFVDAKTLKKFDYLAKNQGLLVLFLIFLLPVFPDDLICYIAGLTAIPIRKLIIVSILGRLPGFVVLSYSGSGFAETNYTIVIIIGVISTVLMVIGYWQRKRLERIVHALAKQRKN